ncbi:MAG: hypothetical protein FJ279_11510 [Planctomycetes bacterium]|nr:hypothetical protein [Planctomycetota bacterium]
MNHFASPQFWECYDELPASVRQLADRCYELMKRDPRHPSLCLKKVGRYYAARVGLRYRGAVAAEAPDGLVWFWIGTHAQYDQVFG